MPRYTSWTRPQDEADEARPSFRPTSHLGSMSNINGSPPYRRMPVRLNLQKVAKLGPHKSPQPRRLGLTYVQTPKGQKVVRRNIENEQFIPQTTSNIVRGESKKTSESKIPLPETSRPRALNKIDVNRSERKMIPNMAGSEQLTSPLFPLAEYAPRIAGEANAFQALQGIRNDNRHDLRSVALRNASNLKSTVALSVSKTPSLGIYTGATRFKVPDSPKLVLSVKKTSGYDHVPYVNLLNPTCSKTISTTSETKTQHSRPRTCLLNDFSHQASGALQTVAKLPSLQSTGIPMTTSVEDNEVALWLSKHKTKYESSTHKNKQISEHEAAHGRIDEQVPTDKSCLEPCSPSDILRFFKNLKDDHQKQMELHQKMAEIQQKSIKSLQDFIDMYSISVPAKVNCTTEMKPEIALNLSVEAQSTSKKRRSLRIAARSGGIVDESSGCGNTADGIINDAHTYISPTVVITNADESTTTLTNNFNKTLDIASPLLSAKKNVLSRKSISKYRALQNSFHGILNTPMKTPIIKSTRKKLPLCVETPGLSRRVQASLELLLDDEEITSNMK